MVGDRLALLSREDGVVVLDGLDGGGRGEVVVGDWAERRFCRHAVFVYDAPTGVYSNK